MRRLLTFTLIAISTLAIAKFAVAHCQVPCGIYGDQRRFETMLEDTATIAKGITEINGLASKSDALSKNQLTRWVNTKEDHASNTQKIIAEYFMAQRIKPGSDGYAKKLAAAHAVMVAAMKCKQTVAPASAKALQKSIYAFYEAYEGKKPNFE
jgi:nickel superoxide dismutase